MPKAGHLTRSVSRHVRPAETPMANNHYADAMQTLSSAQSRQPHAGYGYQLRSDEMIIGLALGSPRQNATFIVSADDRDNDVPCVCSSPENPTSMFGDVFDMGSEHKSIKRKGGKLKSLGSFFVRREVQSASSCCQLDQQQQLEPAKQLNIQDQLETHTPFCKQADSDHGCKVHQIGLSRNVSKEKSSGMLRKSSSRRTGLRRRKINESQRKVQQIPAEHTASAIAQSLERHGEQQESRMTTFSLLQVEIPCVAMERYSVMFGDVLKPQAWQSMRQPSPLSCRQGPLEEMHTVANPDSQSLDTALPEADMRADTHLLESSRSSSSSLFPSTSPNLLCSPANKLLQKPSALRRTSTEPSRRLLPPKPTIKKSESQDQDHVLVTVQKSSENSKSSTSPCRQPSSNPFQRSNPATTGFFGCSEYSGYSYETIEADAARSKESAQQHTSQRAFPARTSSLKKAVPLEIPNGYQGEDLIDSQVSVARQISILRRQRQLLVPIAPKMARQPIQPKVNQQNAVDDSRKPHFLTPEDG